MHEGFHGETDSPNRGVCVIRLDFAVLRLVQARASRFGGLSA
jgi:hypothetical protein